MATTSKPRVPFTSPYNEFCRVHRALVPANLTNAARERLMGDLWAR